MTWQEYEADLEPARRICTHVSIEEHIGRNRPAGQYIPKADGRQRPLAIAALEDKIVQGAPSWC